MRKIKIGMIASLLCLVSPSLSHGQVSREEVRREQRDIIMDLRRTEKSREESGKAPGWRMNGGSWYALSFTGSENDDRDAKTQDVLDHSWENDLRFFALAQSGTGRTKIYTRVGTQFSRNTTSSRVISSTDWVQPSVDMMYLEKTFGSKRLRSTVTVGRQYVQVRNALALAVVADGLSYELKSRRQTYGAFVLHQLPGDNNIDFLAANSGRSKRWFYGMEYSWNYHPSNGLNFFTVGNADGNSDKPDVSGQRHQFNSNYLGATIYGTVLSGLSYELQYIMEMGSTYSDTNSTNPSPNNKVDIDAQAMTFDLDYYFAGSLGFVLHAAYLYGSGDGDAVGNVFSTDGGSGSLTGSGTGGKDSRFMSFGGKSLGYAFAPTLSNLRVIKTGFSIKPFGWSENRLWEDFKVQPQIYFYSRDKAAGATSDPYMVRGSGASANIGTEFDLAVSWRLMSDVKYSLKWGRFSPGSAYVTKSPETYLRLNISLDL